MALSALLLGADLPAHGQTETVLYSFGTPGDGFGPVGVVLDAKGNLYGTTSAGGAYNYGTVFELTPSGVETILWNFGNGTDGRFPSGVVFDKNGNLYGTTYSGGTNGYGTVFELTPSATETILWNFGNGTDGQNPRASLILDAKGNLYGTTSGGGAYSFGTVFELTPSGSETILHSFDNNGTDGQVPGAALALDKNGNLYGTTYLGGVYGWGGTVFKVAASGNEKVLYSFNPHHDGYWPQGSLVLGKKGKLYGTTSRVYGNLFELKRRAGVWRERILWSFGFGTDGQVPLSPLVLDKKGNLYGTTAAGGLYGCANRPDDAFCGYGTVFKLTPSATETILWNFGNGTDGQNPSSGVVSDENGNLYGTTYAGGAYNLGTVFKVTP